MGAAIPVGALGWGIWGRRGGTGSVLSHGGSPEQKSRGEMSETGCRWGFSGFVLQSWHGGVRGGHHNPCRLYHSHPSNAPGKGAC